MDEIFNDLKKSQDTEVFLLSVIDEMLTCPYSDRLECIDLIGFGWYSLCNRTIKVRNVAFEWVLPRIVPYGHISIWLLGDVVKFFIDHKEISRETLINYLTFEIWQKIVWTV